jgi:hypothetical protein
MAGNVFYDSCGLHFPIVRGIERPDAAEPQVKVEVDDSDLMASVYCYSGEMMIGSATEQVKWFLLWMSAKSARSAKLGKVPSYAWSRPIWEDVLLRWEIVRLKRARLSNQSCGGPADPSARPSDILV